VIGCCNQYKATSPDGPPAEVVAFQIYRFEWFGIIILWLNDHQTKVDAQLSR